MDKKSCAYFKRKLEQERKNINHLLEVMKKNETVHSKAEIASELSYYDNHPSDIATELYDIERGMAFEVNEEAIIKKIDGALKRIETGEYGICKECKKPISEARLNFLPYAEYCIECQNKKSTLKERNLHHRTAEEEILGNFFSKTNKYDSEFDREDTYEAVESFNKMPDVYDYYENDIGYVESVEKISNEQYKNQLPD